MAIKSFHFEAQEAKNYGIYEAIFIEFFRFYIEINKAANRNFHDGYFWTFNSVTSLQKTFWFMSFAQIKNTIKNLQKKQILIHGNYNKKRYDKTKWYTFKHPEIFLGKEEPRLILADGQEITEKPKPELTNGLDRISQPIPVNNTVNNITDIDSNSKSEFSSAPQKQSLESNQHNLSNLETEPKNSNEKEKRTEEDKKHYNEIKQFFTVELNGNIHNPKKWWPMQSKGLKNLEAYPIEEIKKSYNRAKNDPANKGLIITPLLLQSKMKFGLNGNSIPKNETLIEKAFREGREKANAQNA